MLHTEHIALRYRGFDQWAIQEIVHELWESHLASAAVVSSHLNEICAAVHEAAQRLSVGQGRLVYCGAGSAGMIGALDALDLHCTFSWPEERVAILMPAGLDLSKGLAAVKEDNDEQGAHNVSALNLSKNDVFIGISASGESAYTVGALEMAHNLGALTIAVTNNVVSSLGNKAQCSIIAQTGAEVIAGSTRLGAGTAQKIILNTFSSALMTSMGFVYDNLMIEMSLDNKKLIQRGIGMICTISRVGELEAKNAFLKYGTIKAAVLALEGVSDTDIQSVLFANGNNLRNALKDVRQKRGYSQN